MRSTFVDPLFTKKLYRDKDVQEAIIEQSQTDWTIVRPGPFREGPAKEELQVVTDVGETVLPRISPAEVAQFVLDELKNNQYVFKRVFIGHPR